LEPLKRDPKGRATKRTNIPLMDTQASKALNFASFDSQSHWNRCRFVVSASGEECLIASWVFANSPLDVSRMHDSITVNGTYQYV
jgi:hypothetical protein